MKVSKSQQACVNRYIKEKYDRINLTLPKGIKEKIRVVAFKQGKSVNQFIQDAIYLQLEAFTLQEK